MQAYAANELSSQLVIDAVCMRLSAGLESLNRLEPGRLDELGGADWPLMWGMRDRIAHGFCSWTPTSCEGPWNVTSRPSSTNQRLSRLSRDEGRPVTGVWRGRTPVAGAGGVGRSFLRAVKRPGAEAMAVKTMDAAATGRRRPSRDHRVDQ